MRRALFIDRDGVLIRDIHLMKGPADAELLPGAPRALSRARDAGLAIVVVTNQSVVARGLCTEAEVAAVHLRIDELLAAAGAPSPDGYYVCPHHPEADVPAMRQVCACRKPAPGLLLRAADELGLDCGGSFMVGDRLTDVLAGHRAGCTTVLVDSPAAAAPLIAGVREEDLVAPDLRARDLGEAVDRILGTLS